VATQQREAKQEAIKEKYIKDNNLYPLLTAPSATPFSALTSNPEAMKWLLASEYNPIQDPKQI